METMIAEPKVKVSRMKVFEIQNPTNKLFYSEFEKNFNNPTSWLQYKVDAGAFLENLKQKLLTSIEPAEIESYIENSDNENTIRNKRSHIRSLLIFTVKNNINGAKSKVSRDMLIYLIG
jgi:hypothetical protein